MEEIHLPYNVPYSAQVISGELAEAILSGQLAAESDPRWAESGAADPAEYAYWTLRACGVACLKMCVDALGGTQRSLVEWARAGVAGDGYLVQEDANGQAREIGWRHDALAELCHGRGLQSEALPATLDEIAAQLRLGRAVIASVSYEIGTLAPVTRKGGHLVVVSGVALDSNGKVVEVILNNPSGRLEHLRAGARISAERFAAGFTGRIISVWR